jgi:hypothetical protein
VNGAGQGTRRALRVTADVVRALSRLHRSGVSHGGVWPGAVEIRGDRAALRPPAGPVPPEYRDPERGRELLRDPSRAGKAGPREDVYGAGALLYTLLSGGPPPCGPASRLTRPAPTGVAFVVARALADGATRYPDLRAMRADLDALLRRPETAPEALPSFAGGPVARPPRLVPFAVRAARRRRWPAALAMVLLAGGLVVRAGLLDPRPPPPPDLSAVVASGRAVLGERLGAAGESFPPDLPLLLVADVPLPGPVPGPVLEAPDLSRRAGRILRQGGSAAELHAALRAARPGEDPPPVLWVAPGRRAGATRVVLSYRGVSIEAELGARKEMSAQHRGPRRARPARSNDE